MSQQEPSYNSSTPSPEHHGRKRPASERKILANRRNALRSTGPKTERGKRAVTRNAITHGLLAREVVITAGDGEESQEEFQAFVESVCEHYKPVGPVEGMFVEKIAVSWWRLGRAIRAENGEIRKGLDTLSMDQVLRNEDQDTLGLLFSINDTSLFNNANPADAKVSTVGRYSAMQAMHVRLREHPSGLLHLRVLLELAKSEIASDGYMSEPMRKKIFLMFCFLDLPFAFHCRNAGAPEGKIADRPPKPNTDKETETDPAFTVGLIDLQLKKLSLLKEFASERESLAGDSEARSFSLPPADATEKLLRYEAHLDRQLYRAMDQLERLQRKRGGENVPPPLNINLGKRG
jgi:hypothetical protein